MSDDESDDDQILTDVSVCAAPTLPVFQTESKEYESAQALLLLKNVGLVSIQSVPSVIRYMILVTVVLKQLVPESQANIATIFNSPSILTSPGELSAKLCF